MALYEGNSKFPALHESLSKIPFIVEWENVATTYPSLSHCYWCIITAIMVLFIQLIIYILRILFARKLINYNKYPPIPSDTSLSSYYVKLGQHVKYENHIQIEKYDIKKELSVEVCNNKLTESEIKSWLIRCNKYHAKNLSSSQKFQEYLFPIITKSLTLFYGCYIIYDQAWVYDGNLFFDGWPNEQGLDKIPDIKFLYIFHIGFYLYKIFSSILVERRLKDWVESLIHHVVSFTLLVLSYYSGFIRIGVVVLLLHDPADIVMQSAKFCRLIHLEILCNVFFVGLCVSWLATRVLIYPYHCILSGIKLGIDRYPNTEMPIWILSVLMCILYCLHLYWFKLLIEAVIRTLKGKGISDHRSGDDEKDGKDC